VPSLRAIYGPNVRPRANPFIGNSYEKCARKSFRSHSCVLLNLKSFVGNSSEIHLGEGSPFRSAPASSQDRLEPNVHRNQAIKHSSAKW